MTNLLRVHDAAGGWGAHAGVWLMPHGATTAVYHGKVNVQDRLLLVRSGGL
jgi:hypothetical protein